MNTSHERTKGHPEWITPPEIIKSLGPFDLDPCAPVQRPWPTARVHYTEKGLEKDWFGRVWLNPPYGKELYKWMSRMKEHMNGIALIFARVDTKCFQDDIFGSAKTMFCLRGRLRFYNIWGQQYPSNAGAPSVLLSYSEQDAYILESSMLPGYHISLSTMCYVTLVDKTWREVVRAALIKLSGRARVSDITRQVEASSPRKCLKNSHYKAKIRQTLQIHFKRVSRGTYELEIS